MYYAIVRDDVIEKSGTLKDLFPTSTFPLDGPDEDFCSENNLVKVFEFIDHKDSTHKLDICDPYILDGVVYRVSPTKFSKTEVAANKKAVEEFNALQGE